MYRVEETIDSYTSKIVFKKHGINSIYWVIDNKVASGLELKIALIDDLCFKDFLWFLYYNTIKDYYVYLDSIFIYILHFIYFCIY